MEENNWENVWRVMIFFISLHSLKGNKVINQLKVD